jgi:anti-sigma B factor antagonist
VIIDLSGVSFCAVSRLALLIGAKRRARLHGLTIALAAPRPNVAKLLRITGLDRAFTIHPPPPPPRLGRTYGDHPAAA